MDKFDELTEHVNRVKEAGLQLEIAKEELQAYLDEWVEGAKPKPEDFQRLAKDNPSELPELLTVREAADISRISRAYLYKLIREQKAPFFTTEQPPYRIGRDSFFEYIGMKTE